MQDTPLLGFDDPYVEVLLLVVVDLLGILVVLLVVLPEEEGLL
jgi:hypothetical protein